jgi:hypothetical protein
MRKKVFSNTADNHRLKISTKRRENVPDLRVPKIQNGLTTTKFPVRTRVTRVGRNPRLLTRTRTLLSLTKTNPIVCGRQR